MRAENLEKLTNSDAKILVIESILGNCVKDNLTNGWYEFPFKITQITEELGVGRTTIYRIIDILESVAVAKYNKKTLKVSRETIDVLVKALKMCGKSEFAKGTENDSQNTVNVKENYIDVEDGKMFHLNVPGDVLQSENVPPYDENCSKDIFEMSQGGTKMSQGGTKMSQGGTKMSQGGTKMSQGGTKMSQGGTKMSHLCVTNVSEIITGTFLHAFVSYSEIQNNLLVNIFCNIKLEDVLWMRLYLQEDPEYNGDFQDALGLLLSGLTVNDLRSDFEAITEIDVGELEVVLMASILLADDKMVSKIIKKSGISSILGNNEGIFLQGFADLLLWAAKRKERKERNERKKRKEAKEKKERKEIKERKENLAERLQYDSNTFNYDYNTIPIHLKPFRRFLKGGEAPSNNNILKIIETIEDMSEANVFNCQVGGEDKTSRKNETELGVGIGASEEDDGESEMPPTSSFSQKQENPPLSHESDDSPTSSLQTQNKKGKGENVNKCENLECEGNEAENWENEENDGEEDLQDDSNTLGQLPVLIPKTINQSIEVNFQAPVTHKKKIEYPYHSAEDIISIPENVEKWVTTTPRLFVYCLWTILSEFTGISDAEVGECTQDERKSLKTPEIALKRYCRDIQQPAYDMMEEIIEKGMVELEDRTIPVDVKIINPRDVDLTTDFEVVEDEGERYYQISPSRIRDLDNPIETDGGYVPYSQRQKDRPKKSYREKIREGREEDLAYMKAIMQTGDDETSRDNLTPIEYAAYLFLGNYFEIAEDGTTGDPKFLEISRREFKRFMIPLYSEGVKDEDFLGITRAGRLRNGDNALNLTPRMFSAEKICLWNARNDLLSHLK